MKSILMFFAFSCAPILAANNTQSSTRLIKSLKTLCITAAKEHNVLPKKVMLPIVLGGIKDLYAAAIYKEFSRYQIAKLAHKQVTDDTCIILYNNKHEFCIYDKMQNNFLPSDDTHKLEFHYSHERSYTMPFICSKTGRTKLKEWRPLYKLHNATFYGPVVLIAYSLHASGCWDVSSGKQIFNTQHHNKNEPKLYRISPKNAKDISQGSKGRATIKLNTLMLGILNKKETDKKHLTHREWKLLWDASQSWKNNTPHSITKKQYVTLMTDLSYSPIEELIKNETFFKVAKTP